MNNIESLARSAREASRALAALPTHAKNSVLNAFADAIDQSAPALLEANAQDLAAAQAAGLPAAKLQRLTLTSSSLGRLAEGLRQVARLPDPVGLVTSERSVPSGLAVRRVRVPLGVICMIYEARPGVTADAFALCLKSGNACLLKGGREAFRSNAAIASIARRVLEQHHVPSAAITLLDASDREELRQLLQLDSLIDLVIPRGGEDLIRFVAQHSRIPTIQHFKGVCHIFVDSTADLDRAVHVCVTAKTSAPATCNAAECLLVHREIAGAFLPRLANGLAAAGVEVRADPTARAVVPAWKPVSEDDFGREFLDTILALRVVDGVAAAIDHIARYGSRHTEAILSASPASIAAFRAGVDASCVAVNASTRFNDGFQLGLGAEIGISTTKLHAYGPMGLEELTTQRFEIDGQYQTR
ncbi:MAG: glutamate-5-semialdehyde dehydrogenase [Phycisphaerales bacterium]|nr:glutamate-5-semialdehyde dehydrogenase [Phycisphaerales bacterium]